METFLPLALILGLVLFLFTACGTSGSGVEKTEDRTVEAFSSVILQGMGKIDATVGPAHALKIRTDDNLLPLVKTTVEGGVLTVELPKNASTSIGVNLTLQTPTLESAVVEGAIQIAVAGHTAGSFSLSARGASKATLTGALETATLDCEGAVSVDATALQAKNMVVKLKGAGKADVTASETLDITIEGVGKVTYAGDPHVTPKLDGVGKI
ncbi:MAG: DUF2807 domain-containing protein, partial [Myxococcota bacterium]|nr:DUF2807 domain-containing protein [Myxococcota bacterium]